MNEKFLEQNHEKKSWADFYFSADNFLMSFTVHMDLVQVLLYE